MNWKGDAMSKGTTVKRPTRAANTTRLPRSAPARDRLLATAAELFYERGVHAVGIDEIIERSGVAKMSLYNNFDSKDALIVAYLRARHEKWMEWLRTSVEGRAATPRRRLLAVFDAIAEWCGRNDFRGCAFINAAAEVCDPRHPARAVCREHRASLLAYLEGLSTGAALKHPREIAGQLLLLLDGAIVSSVLTGSAAPVAHAKAAAQVLVGRR
jgi:AcrR family transcriptional regulator